MMKPETEAELAEMVAGAKGPLRIQGGGTRAIGNPVTGELLQMSGLSGVVTYEPGSLTLVVQAGTPVAEVEAVLAAEGQRLPFEPMDHRGLLGTDGEPTMGGLVAANVSGPRRIQVGACRDFLLGVRFVDGTGRVLKNGGRVMKNVTGYDLVKLMAGSWGTLGVMTELSFKVLAQARAETTLVARGLSVADGVAALTRALGSAYDVSGAAFQGDEGRAQVRLEGLPGSVAYRVEQLQRGGLAGFDVVEGEASAALWREVRDVAPFAGENGAVWRVSVKPTDAPGFCDSLNARGIAHRMVLDWGGGLVWLMVDDRGHAGPIREELARIGGHATLIRGPKSLRSKVAVFQPEPAPLAAITVGLRAKFDPKGILNPGLMG